jgi:hypothetical protein
MQPQPFIHAHRVFPPQPSRVIVQEHHHHHPAPPPPEPIPPPPPPPPVPLTTTEITETVRTVRRRPRAVEKETIIEQTKPAQVKHK